MKTMSIRRHLSGNPSFKVHQRSKLVTYCSSEAKVQQTIQNFLVYSFQHNAMVSIILLLLSSIHIHITKADLQLEKELDKGCENKVTAACDSLRGDGTIYLFSGKRTFVFDPQQQIITDVLLTFNDVGNVTFPVDSAAASRREYGSKDFIMMTTGGTISVFVNTNNGKNGAFVGHGTMKSLDNKQGIEVQTGEAPDCMAAACYKDDKSCHYWRIFNDHQETTKVFHCRSAGVKSVSCEYSHVFEAPKWMSQDMLMDLPKTKCEAMAITVNDEKQETALTFIDNNGLHYFVNDKKLYSIPLGQIFDCASFWSSPLFIVGGISVVFLIVAIPVLVFVLVKSRRHFDDEDVDDVTRFQRTKAKVEPKLVL